MEIDNSQNQEKKIIIAIDGYSSCGKSTLSKALAKKLNYIYIDSGAMYRAVSYYCAKFNINTADERAVNNAIQNIKIDFFYNPENEKNEIWLNNEPVENKLRGLDIASKASQISQYKLVRKKLVALQQLLGKNKGIVMDGRDIGTVVFPKAELKLFIVADISIRVDRRYNELLKKGIIVDKKEVEKNLIDRDLIDVSRKESPLIKADDAKEIDNSFLNPQEQLNLSLFLANETIKTLK